MDRKERLYLLARMNAGRRLFPEYAEHVGAALGRPVAEADFLPVMTTDRVRSAFERPFDREPADVPDILSGWDDLAAMEADLAALAGSLGTVLLFLSESERTGALPVDAAEVLPRAGAVLDVSDRSFTVSDGSGANSLAVWYDDDWNANGGLAPYEAHVLGPSWVVELAPFLRAV